MKYCSYDYFYFFYERCMAMEGCVMILRNIYIAIASLNLRGYIAAIEDIRLVNNYLMSYLLFSLEQSKLVFGIRKLIINFHFVMSRIPFT